MSLSYGDLWLPILVSAVVVFVASSVLHMLLTYHKADFRKLPGEDAVAAAMRKENPAPGRYMLPHCESHKEFQDPAVVEKFTKGPVAQITVMPSGPPAMGKNLAQWFAFCVLVGFVCAYVARHAVGAEGGGMPIMRITGTVAFVGYGMSSIIDSIWHAVPWSSTARALVDGLIYAILTGLTFRLLV
jgi:hypothetical protein